MMVWRSLDLDVVWLCTYTTLSSLGRWAVFKRSCCYMREHVINYLTLDSYMSGPCSCAVSLKCIVPKSRLPLF